MTDTIFDIAIIGSGPAGISTAFPLLEAGLKVIMVDGGNPQTEPLPTKPYLAHRFEDIDQWKWMVGKDYFALSQKNEGSPKLRIPTHKNVFARFARENQIESEGFITIGSLAPGGLSNAWGCGVAKLSENELSSFPFTTTEINPSYERVIKRIGVSGAENDDLLSYFGVDEWAQPAISMDGIHAKVIENYSKKKSKLANHGMKMGRSRVAVLNHDMGDRKGCNLTGNCMWGCSRKAIYSAVDEIPKLKRFPNFKYRSGFIVDRIETEGGFPTIVSARDGQTLKITAKKLVLAAGTLATTRLALKALQFKKPVPVQSSPTAAFLIWFPGQLGTPIIDTFGLGQLSYSLNITPEIAGFGSTFSSTGIPATEFIRHLPLKTRFSIDFWSQIASSCVIGNLFLPGHLSTSYARLNDRGGLDLKGGYKESLAGLMKQAHLKLFKSYLMLGGIILPRSFQIGAPGGDIHYSSTLPMSNTPHKGETDRNGLIFGLKNVYAVDGSVLPSLTEKSHTLTIMANADRIARNLVTQCI